VDVSNRIKGLFGNFSPSSADYWKHTGEYSKKTDGNVLQLILSPREIGVLKKLKTGI
jgi:hypothetical protein